MKGLESYAKHSGVNSLDVFQMCNTHYTHDPNVAPHASAEKFKQDLLAFYGQTEVYLNRTKYAQQEL